MQSSTVLNAPQLQLPKTAQKRRRKKKTEPVRFGLNTLKRIVFSSRWISLALLAVAIYALVDIYQQQRFYLTYIPVEGTVSLSPEEIADASGLAGSHVFAVDPAQAASDIGTLPGIISSTVTLRWPNQVYIEVAEEAAVAIWQENGVEYGVTASGRLFPAVRPNPTLLRIESEIPVIPQTPDGDGTPSELAVQDPDAAEEAGDDLDTSLSFVPAEVLDGAMQLRELRPTIERLYYQPNGGLSYQDGRGWRGYFGTGVEMNQKLAIYESLVADLLARGLQPEYVSVSNQEKPYYRVSGAPPVVEDDQSQ
jgi:hypothetical protein